MEQSLLEMKRFCTTLILKSEIQKKSQSFEYKNLTVSINRLTQKRIIDVKVTVNTIPEDEEEEEVEK